MKAPPYPKIDTLFDRSEHDFKVNPDKVRRPEFYIPEYWLITEKIHGMNVRISLERCSDMNLVSKHSLEDCPGWVVCYGTKEKDGLEGVPPEAQIFLYKQFTIDRMKEVCLRHKGELYEFCVYGELYGPRIQKGGGDYRAAPGLRVFDVYVFGPEYPEEDGYTPLGGYWLRWSGIEDVARELGVEPVPAIASIPLDQAVAFVKDPVLIQSLVASKEGYKEIPAEGVVARTDPSLFNNKGERVMWKLKVKDLR